MITSQQYRPLDDLKRDDLPEAPKAIADTLDEWRHREHGIIAGHHGVGLFLDLLADAGYTVVRLNPNGPTVFTPGAQV